MYENMSVPAPTREGWWIVYLDGQHPRLEKIRLPDGGDAPLPEFPVYMKWDFTRARWDWRDLDRRSFTGPIPVPEDKPVLKPLRPRPGPGVTISKPAPSEDEGEKWGSLLWEMWINPKGKHPHDRREWLMQSPGVRQLYEELALSFRAEVLKEERDPHLHYDEGKGITAKEAGEAALRIGEDAERGRLEADKPRVSAEELGRVAIQAYQDRVFVRDQREWELCVRVGAEIQKVLGLE